MKGLGIATAGIVVLAAATLGAIYGVKKLENVIAKLQKPPVASITPPTTAPAQKTRKGDTPDSSELAKAPTKKTDENNTPPSEPQPSDSDSGETELEKLRRQLKEATEGMAGRQSARRITPPTITPRISEAETPKQQIIETTESAEPDYNPHARCLNEKDAVSDFETRDPEYIEITLRPGCWGALVIFPTTRRWGHWTIQAVQGNNDSWIAIIRAGENVPSPKFRFPYLWQTKPYNYHFTWNRFGEYFQGSGKVILFPADPE